MFSDRRSLYIKYLISNRKVQKRDLSVFQPSPCTLEKLHIPSARPRQSTHGILLKLLIAKLGLGFSDFTTSEHTRSKVGIGYRFFYLKPVRALVVEGHWAVRQIMITSFDMSVMLFQDNNLDRAVQFCLRKLAFRCFLLPHRRQTVSR